MRPSLTVAVAQPVCRAGDVRANGAEHARLIRAAQARVVVFPELSLTGYELDAAAVSPDDGALATVGGACGETGSTAFLGAPVPAASGRTYIATLRVDASGARVAYRKSHLGGDEPRRFASGDGPAAIELDGWRIGLGICKDTGADRHVAGIAALGIDLYLAGVVDRPEEITAQEERAARIARACHAYVAFASFAGPTGGGYDRTAGASTIRAPDGTVLVRAGAEPGCVARASLG